MIASVKLEMSGTVYWVSSMEIPDVSENLSQCPSISESLGRLNVQMFITEGSNHLTNFPMCTECKKEWQKPIKRPKTKD